MYLDSTSRFYGSPKRRRYRSSFSQRTWLAVRKLIYWRHQGPCDTDDWIFYVDAVLPLLIQLSKEKGHPDGWVRQMADEMFPLMDCGPEWWADQVEEASKPVGIRVDIIAKRLGIREIELDKCFGPNRRKRGGLVSIDRPRKVRIKERKEEKAVRQFFRRGGTEPACRVTLEDDKPWIYLGISRATWFRRERSYRQAETRLIPNTLTYSSTPQKVSAEPCGNKDRYQEEELT